MSTQVVTPEVIGPVVASGEPEVAPITPVIEASAVVAPHPELKWYEYQPCDEHHRAVGGKQRFSYTTTDELIKKLETAHSNSILGMRDVKRKARLGTSEDIAIPAELERIPASVQFKEKPLSAEERFSISQDLTDPTKFDAARDRLLESAIGVPPAQLRDTLNQQTQQTQQIVARQNAEVWLERHPEFYACAENINTVCEWMTKNGLQPSVRNFEFAQTQMAEAGLLLSSPIVREVPPVPQPQVVTPVAAVVPNPQVPALEPVRINEVPVPQSSAEVPTEKRTPQSHVPSGLNNRIAPVGAALTPSATDSLTLRDIDAMSSDQYRKALMTVPGFAKRVDELEATRPPKPRR
jgi:hypothetical protein